MALPIVCIAGGGTAGLEALLSARDLLGDRVELAVGQSRTGISLPSHAFRPAARARPRALDRGCGSGGRHWRRGVYDRVVEVREADGALLTRDGDLVDFDYLLLATGARGERMLKQGDVWERGRDPVALDETLQTCPPASSRAQELSSLVARAGRCLLTSWRW